MSLRHWSERVRNAYGSLEGRSVWAELWLPDDTEFPEVAVGFILGFFDTSHYRSLLIEQGVDEAGVFDFAAEEDAFDRLEKCDQPRVDRARNVWLLAIFRMLLHVYRTGAEEPLWELREFAAAWGPEAESLISSIEPQGLDRLFFGRQARARFLDRLERVVSAT